MKKTETFTIKAAFAWDAQVLTRKLMLENNKSFILGDVNFAAVINVPHVEYYSDAVRMAITRYIADKVYVLDHDIKVVMTVKTKDGLEPYYDITIGHLFNPNADMLNLQRELVQPTAVKLALSASKEIPFANVESVSCYVEEVDSSK